MNLNENIWINDVLNVKIDTSMLRNGGGRTVIQRQCEESVVT